MYIITYNIHTSNISRHGHNTGAQSCGVFTACHIPQFWANFPSYIYIDLINWKNDILVIIKFKTIFLYSSIIISIIKTFTTLQRISKNYKNINNSEFVEKCAFNKIAKIYYFKMSFLIVFIISHLNVIKIKIKNYDILTHSTLS